MRQAYRSFASKSTPSGTPKLLHAVRKSFMSVACKANGKDIGVCNPVACLGTYHEVPHLPELASGQRSASRFFSTRVKQRNDRVQLLHLF